MMILEILTAITVLFTCHIKSDTNFLPSDVIGNHRHERVTIGNSPAIFQVACILRRRCHAPRAKAIRREAPSSPQPLILASPDSLPQPSPSSPQPLILALPDSLPQPSPPAPKIKEFDGPVTLFGMKLATITPELRERYAVPLNEYGFGAIVLDPGPRIAEIGVANLREGDYFDVVGTRRVRSLSEFIAQLRSDLNSPLQPAGGPYLCRVVYVIPRPELGFTGTSTRFLRLTNADLEELERVFDEIGSSSDD